MRTISHSTDGAERPGHHAGVLVLVVRMPRFGPSEPQRQALAYLGPAGWPGTQNGWTLAGHAGEVRVPGLLSSLSVLAVPLDERGERAVHPALHGVGQVGPQPGGGDDGVDRAHAVGPLDAVPAVELVGDLA